jgi:hypothetical protein
MRIRRIPVSALFLMLLACPAAAAPLRWGIRAGVNGAKFAGDYGDAVPPEGRFGLNAGFMGEADLSHVLSLHGEIAYSSKGGRGMSNYRDFTGNFIFATDTWIYDYIEVPVLLRARLQRGRSTALFAEAGPSFGIALAGRLTTDIPSGFPDIDLKDQMKTVDAGYALGAGIEFPAGPGWLGIDVRYTRGFSDLHDVSGNGNATVINQVLTLAASWMR